MENKGFKGTRKLDNGIYVMSVGYRNETPVALLEKTTYAFKDYVIAFNYKIQGNKISWGYGYYYQNIDKAKEDFKRVLSGKNLADTFCKKNEDIER